MARAPLLSAPAPPKVRRGRKGAPPDFDRCLVLADWLLSLFGAEDLRALAGDQVDADCAWDAEGRSNFLLHLIDRPFERPELPDQDLRRYDAMLRAHTEAISARRREPIRWKYFQYLGLLFTEVYLDRWSRDRAALRGALNAHLRSFEAQREAGLPEYGDDDLRKLAYWQATGSGKTLLMHVHLLQVRHYARREPFDRVLLITPNAGLTRQHLEELRLSGIAAEEFRIGGGDMYAKSRVQVLEIHRLGEERGQIREAVCYFEDGRNLVLVDEGHRGTASELGKWKEYRDRLGKKGFTLEYSATFRQAVKASGSKALRDEYARAIVLDYSYKHFYRDGYGKDYRILNLADEEHGPEKRKEHQRRYLTGALLAFFQQLLVHRRDPGAAARYRIERPLLVFVGSSVSKAPTAQECADVVEILRFLAAFVRDGEGTRAVLETFLHGRADLTDGDRDVFAGAFPVLERQGWDAGTLYSELLRAVFGTDLPGELHVTLLKEADGEIALSIGQGEPFGVINVGDPRALKKELERERSIRFAEREFAARSLFAGIGREDSTIHVLVGARKFTEGWNSFRVSAMGLMNVGKSEGAQVIQLFGRGVRLRGWEGCLKRSAAVRVPGLAHPQDLPVLETLNVFAVRGRYMDEFRKKLEEEGVETGPQEEDTIDLEVVRTVPQRELVWMEGPERPFRRAVRPVLEYDPRVDVELDLWARVQARLSRGAGELEVNDLRGQARTLSEEHLAFLDHDALYRELLALKEQEGWWNLSIPRGVTRTLLRERGWYKLRIPEAELEVRDMGRVALWQEIAAALLRKYAARFYLVRKNLYETEHARFRKLDWGRDGGLVPERWRVSWSPPDEAVAGFVRELAERVKARDWESPRRARIETPYLPGHLFQPLVQVRERGERVVVRTTPVALNEGEAGFVRDLRRYVESGPAALLGVEVHLLRNQSRKGLGFFEANGFYPDFILWLVRDGVQHVVFVDPKGIGRLGGIDDAKVRLFRVLKDIERRQADPGVRLHSFVVSVTPRASVPFRRQLGDLAEHHVVFQEDRDRYVGEIVETVLGGG